MNSHHLNWQHQGHTLIEMLVAMAVTSVVLAGTYAAYGFFARQQQLNLSQSELSRNAMRAIDLMQTDIRMAGFKDYNDPDPMTATQPIVIAKSNPGDLRIVYDDYDDAGSVRRLLTRYYLQTYTSSESGLQRNRLMRQVRRCSDPATFCDLTSSVAMASWEAGEPLLDWVNTFEVIGNTPKPDGSFKDQFQTLMVNLTLKSPKKLENASSDTTRNFSFVGRARNVSLVP